MPDLNKKTKILYVITKSNWGGAQRYVYDIATSLNKEMFGVAVAAGGEGILAEKLNRAGIRTMPIPFLQRDVSVIKEFLSLFALVKIFNRERPDIIHLNSSKTGGLGAVAARISSLVTRRSSLIVFTAHGWGFNEDRPYVARLIIFLAQWITVIFCHKIITLSKAVHSQAMYFPFSRKKIFFTEQGLQPIELLPREEAKKELISVFNKTNPSHKEFPGLWVGCVAELTKNKGVIYLVEAASKLTGCDSRLLILGDGEDRDKLELQISRLGLQNKVFLSGFVPDAAKYFKSFDIFVLPSVTEALGYALIEAGQAGLPVVATKVGGIPWIIKDGESGILVPPKNPEALAGALKKLLDDNGLRQQMGRKNYELISQKFSFEKMLKETIDIYNKA
ncbi:hypothetical protein A2661_00305 [Candidatus Giovannonibacteria bacterium RIFCSPHIGHO2_01_FULL_45_24]|uniref:Second mannosyl transferase n=1 Tax=Candidatus Giovannonibacteria bacterium RIFCSPLOWO2_01_FULL_46_32 TaxID=1798353 RepID=A0A1F5XGM8_9BACT|nr:MAG: hypothetical protein A2661_00305 [Candidatus Giovannonibacteria bacterium RIFCSPHIGHO2_01_FULL_45_24]OGF87020.1 MAG: hypothetical protein A3B19_01145 [Candidatus Giovannonibacteria bacterium RIFCSPLOWO2_01_FULL_46_32]